MNTKVFVGNLTHTTTDQELFDHFSSVGKVIFAKVIMDKYSGQSKGFGFVEMQTPSDAQKAIELLHNSDLHGKLIQVKPAVSQQDRPTYQRKEHQNNW